jgi:hypothetical protein
MGKFLDSNAGFRLVSEGKESIPLNIISLRPEYEF